MSVIEVSESKAYRIESIKIKGKKYVSVRQLYKTKKDPNWKPGRQGMTFEVGDDLEAILKKVKVVAKRPDSKFKEINLDKGDE